MVQKRDCGRLLFLAVLVLAVLVLAGCGGGGTKTTTTTTTTATAPPFEAKDALITLADLPAGWAVDRSKSDSSDDGEFCGKKDLKSLVGIKALDKAEAQFAKGGSIPVLFHVVAAYAPGQATTVFAAYRELVAGCTSITTGDGQKLDVAPVSFPSLGDESVPLLFTGDVDGFRIGFYLVAVRVKDGIALIAFGDLSPDVNQAEQFARLATDNLQQAQATP